MSRRDRGTYQHDYSREVLDLVRKLVLHELPYWAVAERVAKVHRIRFTTNNVSGIVHRLRRKGELPPNTEYHRKGGVRSSNGSKTDRVKPAPITLPTIPGLTTARRST